MKTVSEIIKELKKCPMDAHVYWRDHDQTEDEFNGPVNVVMVQESEEIDKCFKLKEGTKIVVFHS